MVEKVQKFQPVRMQRCCLVPSKVVALMRVMTGKKSRNAQLIRVRNDTFRHCCYQNTGKLFGKEEGTDFHEHIIVLWPPMTVFIFIFSHQFLFNCSIFVQPDTLCAQKWGGGGCWDGLDLLMLGWTWDRISWGLYLQAA